MSLQIARLVPRFCSRSSNPLGKHIYKYLLGVFHWETHPLGSHNAQRELEESYMRLVSRLRRMFQNNRDLESLLPPILRCILVRGVFVRFTRSELPIRHSHEDCIPPSVPKAYLPCFPCIFEVDSLSERILLTGTLNWANWFTKGFECVIKFRSFL
jgi:hypothetical protein